MLLVGLTGNIASGKSTAAKIFADHGATIIDSDELARRAVEPDTSAFRQIVRRWGNEILSPDGMLDRAALRRQVFADPSQLEELNRIVHPEVLRLRDREVAAARERGDRITVCDIPLLFEVNAVDEFHRIVLVDAPRPVRLERLTRERNLHETEAMEMIASQMPAELKRARADYVVDNTASPDALAKRVEAVWAALERDASALERGEPLPRPQSRTPVSVPVVG